MCKRVWHRDNELSDVAGTEVLVVTFQDSVLVFPGKGFGECHACVRVIMPASSPEAYLDFFPDSVASESNLLALMEIMKIPDYALINLLTA